MRYQHLALLAALAMALAVSCKKDEAAHAPNVTIITPHDGYTLSIPDTLVVTADVGGDNTVDRATVVVNDANGIPVSEVVSVVPIGNPARIEVEIPITSDHIASGDYTLLVQAWSGDASAKDYRHIGLIGTALRLREVLAIGQPDAGTFTIHRIDSTGAVSLANTFISDLGGAVVNSYAQTFCVMGIVDGPLNALAPDGLQLRWQKPNLSTAGIPWFTSLDIGSDGRVYAGTSDGVLRGYNASTGATEFNAALTTNYHAEHLLVLHDRVVIAEKDITGTQRQLRLCQLSSGAFIADQFLDKDVIALFRRDDSNTLIFGNRNGSGVVEDRNIDGGGGWEPHTWPDPITAVEQLDANTFLVALQSGVIERFTYSNAGSITLTNGTMIADLSLDPVSGLVYAARGTEVDALNPQNGQVVASYAIGDPLRYVLPVLNR